MARITGALDCLLRRPDVDAQRIAMVGISYGSVFTLYTMAVEPRIRYGVAACSFRDFYMDGIDPLRTLGRPFDFTAAELAQWVAPRPL